MDNQDIIPKNIDDKIKRKTQRDKRRERNQLRKEHSKQESEKVENMEETDSQILERIAMNITAGGIDVIMGNKEKKQQLLEKHMQEIQKIRSEKRNQAKNFSTIQGIDSKAR